MAFLAPLIVPAILENIVGPIVKKVLSGHDVPIDNKDVPATTEKVVQAVSREMTAQNITVVPVTSPWRSKINWSAGILLLFTAADFIGHPVPADVQDGLTKAATVLIPLAIIVFKTFFTKGVTAASIK